jgi:hypothetical protein
MQPSSCLYFHREHDRSDKVVSKQVDIVRAAFKQPRNYTDQALQVRWMLLPSLADPEPKSACQVRVRRPLLRYGCRSSYA